jgi:hypothetical protein
MCRPMLTITLYKNNQMNRIKEQNSIIGVPEIVSIIVGEISFLQSMTACEMISESLIIPNFTMDLNTVQAAAIKFFLPDNFTNEADIVLEQSPEELELKISKFLKPYAMFIDVLAAQQNIHNKINLIN